MVANGIKSHDKVESILSYPSVKITHFLCRLPPLSILCELWKLYIAICMDFGPGIATGKHIAGLSWLYVGYNEMHVSSPFANCIETILASS